MATRGGLESGILLLFSQVLPRNDDLPEAWVHFQATPGDGKAEPPLPFVRGFDHTYDIERLEYKFRCNADPDGRVTYDVIFTPDDGGPVTHEPHTIFTHGQTGVGAPPAPLEGTEHIAREESVGVPGRGIESVEPEVFPAPIQ